MIKNINKKIQNLTKRFFQISFFFLYGRIKNTLNPTTSDKIKIKKVHKKNQSYKIFIINEGRLYTDRVNDAAAIIDNQIVEGPSYQLRSNPDDILSPRNNVSAKENIVLKKGTPRIKKKIKGSVISLLAGGGANENYFHWLYDVLPKLSLYEELNNSKFPDFLLVPNNDLHFQKETLNILGFREDQILSSKIYRHLVFNKMYITDHPYNVTNDTRIDHEKIPSWISDWLKEKFLIEKNLIKNKFDKIYIDRSNSESKKNATRGILNENELKSFLKNNGFKFIRLHEISFSNQINIFNNAKIIIGLHGAGFANISFCKPGTRIIELKTAGGRKVIENIAINNKLNFHSLELISQKYENNQDGLITISLNEVKKII